MQRFMRRLSMCCQINRVTDSLTTPSVSSVKNDNKSTDSCELTAVACDEVCIEGSDPDELTSVVCDGDEYERDQNVVRPFCADEKIGSSDPDELTSIVCDGDEYERDQNVVRPFCADEKIGSSDPDELTSVVCDGDEYERTDINQLRFPSVTFLGGSNQSANPKTLTVSTRADNESTDLNKVPSVSVDVPISSRKGHLSKPDDGDEDIHLTALHKKIKRILGSVAVLLLFRIFGIVFIFVDVGFVILDLFTDSTTNIPEEYGLISLAIALFFCVDVLLRLFVDGIQRYFSSVVNTLDAVIIAVILAIDIIYINYDLGKLHSISRLSVLFQSLRCIVLMRIFHLVYQKKQLEILTRRMNPEE